VSQRDPDAVTAIRPPAVTTPERARPSIRRTSHVDMVRTGGSPSELLVAGSARDLRTSADGRHAVIGTASMRARVGADRRLIELETDPDEPAASALLRRMVGSGFRGAMAGCLPAHADEGSLLHLLLDELPIAALLSEHIRRAARVRAGRGDATAVRPRVDVCAGWRVGGATLAAFAAGRLGVFAGPPAPPLDAGDDPVAWHRVGRLPAGAMRRRRRLDVSGHAPLHLDAMFRDTYADETGAEHILHEYSLAAVVDARTLVVEAVDVSPGVLPYADCVTAEQTAGAILGRPIPLLRNVVEQALFGPSTCTHLNDLLRSLADAGSLASAGGLVTVRRDPAVP
jgi:DUF2889 family protein